MRLPAGKDVTAVSLSVTRLTKQVFSLGVLIFLRGGRSEELLALNQAVIDA